MICAENDLYKGIDCIKEADMVHHIVSWKFQEGYTEEEKLAAAAEFRSRIDKVTEVMDG